MPSRNDVAQMFRTPSPGSGSEEEDGGLYQEPSFNPIARALDLDLRADLADYKETPFTIAAQRKNLNTNPDTNNDYRRGGTTRSGIKVAVDRSKPAAKPPTPPPPSVKPAIRRPVDRPGRFRPPPISRGRNKFTPADQAQQQPLKQQAKSRNHTVPVRSSAQSRKNDDPSEVATTRAKNSGWTDHRGRPIPKDPPRKKGIMDVFDEEAKKQEKREAANAKRRETLRRKKAAKAAQEAEERISFSRLPAGSAPNDDFPIIMGFEKQKALPTKSATKANKTKGKGKRKADAIEIIDDESKTHLTQEQVDVLFPANTPPIDTGRRPSSEETMRQLDDADLLSNLAKPDIFKRFDERLEWIERETNQSPSSQPTTITRLNSSAMKAIDTAGLQMSPSSALPYSSPLALAQKARKEAAILHPRPRKQGEEGNEEVMRLEKFAEQEGGLSKPQAFDTSRRDEGVIASAASVSSHDEDFRTIETPNVSQPQIQLHTPQYSSGSDKAEVATSRIKSKPDYAKYRNKEVTASPPPEDQEDTEEWTTFGPSRKRKTSLAAKQSHPSEYESRKRCLDKFRSVNLFPHKPPPANLASPTSDPRTSANHASEETQVAKPKLTLFKPAPPRADKTQDGGYTIVTNKGSKYGSTASSTKYDVETKFVDLSAPAGNPPYKPASQFSGPSPARPRYETPRHPAVSKFNPLHPSANSARHLPPSHNPIHHDHMSSVDRLNKSYFGVQEEEDDDDDDWEAKWERPNAAATRVE
ncbi:hypothetical protein IAU59_000597 [Kwoniella sp. CBS 9459]